MNEPWITILLIATIARLCVGCQDKKLPIQYTYNRIVSVTCPDPKDNSSSTFQLWKGNETIASADINENRTTLANWTVSGVEFEHGQKRFVLSQGMAKRTGLYSCIAKARTSQQGGQRSEMQSEVFVEESQCTEKKCQPEGGISLWDVGFGLLLLCALVLTGVTYRTWSKFKCKDNNPRDYVNVIPRGTRDHRCAQRPHSRPALRP